MVGPNDPRVFIVDDDEAIRDSLSTLLESRGFAVMQFPSGIDFVNAYDLSWQGCALIDVRMPGMDGIEVLQELAKRGGNILLAPIILTAHADVPLAVRAMKAGAVDFLEKPIEPRILLQAVQSNLHRRVSRIATEDNAATIETNARYTNLTPREQEVLEKLVAGLPNKVIAYELSISPRTVELHRARVMRKMEAESLSHLVRLALSIGIEPN